jgi:hypothetical protein
LRECSAAALSGYLVKETAMQDDELAFMLHEVATHEFGCAIKTNAPERLRLRLYPVMKDLGMNFSIQIPKEPGMLWLIPRRYLPVATRPGLLPKE